ncbi:hypothetical protein IGI04_002346 [Brassica rapa subsp. trilocularis]|uniref:DUF1216 domain-containing protein n=1 Tax=Brassica rapa subsp. trilocularis TaxID=1813537 RepID=A0ABQ7NYL3_BRACM|nr:hypothetical protein IGI04_002346 [Brassica rapa subsp. trilocularis]
MVKNSLAIYLMLLIALSTVYETQGTFSLPLYLKNFPKVGQDFESFAYKGMKDFMGDLEGKCPETTEFKDFSVKLKDYMACYSSTSPGAMSAFSGTKGGTSEDSWTLVDGLLSMGKSLVEMKKSGSKEITFEQRKEVIQSMVNWTRGIGLFIKKVSENKGKSIDLSLFGIDYDTNVSSPSERALYETQGTFSLPHYLRDFPKMSKDFEPFAYKGMSAFLGALESKCPATAEFKDLFVKVADYMACFKSGIKIEMQEKSVKLFRAISVLDGTNGETSVDSWRMVDGMLSMGILVTEMKKNVSQEITFEQRKELIGAMVKWARAIGLLVKTASEKKGQSFDLASFGVDYSPHVASPIKGANGEL